MNWQDFKILYFSYFKNFRKKDQKVWESIYHHFLIFYSTKWLVQSPMERDSGWSSLFS
jgi:hypothetical protein